MNNEKKLIQKFFKNQFVYLIFVVSMCLQFSVSFLSMLRLIIRQIKYKSNIISFFYYFGLSTQQWLLETSQDRNPNLWNNKKIA